MASRVSYKEFSTIFGIREAKRGQESSRQGLLLISISQTSRLASIIKSIPNTSKLFDFFEGSIPPEQARIASVAILYISYSLLSSWDKLSHRNYPCCSSYDTFRYKRLAHRN